MGGNFYEEFTKKIDVFFIYLYNFTNYIHNTSLFFIQTPDRQYAI